MRVGALVGLKLRQVEYIKEYGIYKVIAYEGTNDEYVTFCTPECAHAIRTYPDYRERSGEKLTPDSPLLREQFNREDPLRVQKPRHLALDTLKNLIEEILIQAGLRSVTPLTEGKKLGSIRKEVMRAHGFRKYFNTALANAGVSPLVKEKLMGHKTGLEKAYFRPTDKDLLVGSERVPGYLHGVEALTISQEKQLRQQVEKLKAETADIDTMKKSYLDMKLALEKKDAEIKQIYQLLYQQGIIKQEPSPST